MLELDKKPVVKDRFRQVYVECATPEEAQEIAENLNFREEAIETMTAGTRAIPDFDEHDE